MIKKNIVTSSDSAHLFDKFFLSHWKVWYFYLGIISILTTLLIWLSYEQTFSRQSVQLLWLAKYSPDTVFLKLLAIPASMGETTVVLTLAFIHMMLALIFVRVGEQIGIGRRTLFVLFLCLNFSPEYNHSRFLIDSTLIWSLLWLVAVWWFLSWYEKSLITAFIGWAALIWINTFFGLYSLLWALGFPLCFLCWPGRYRHWWQGITERVRFLLVYYLIVALVISFSPEWWETLWQLANKTWQQFQQMAKEISLFMSSDRSFDLDVGTAFLFSLQLVAINALKVAGLPVIFILWLSVKMKISSVLKGRVQLFSCFCLGFSWVITAVALLYQGHVPEDLLFLPILFLFLWLGAKGTYYAIQKISSGAIAPERLLIGGWLLVAYAIASVIQFGPSPVYQRLAGEWVANHPTAGKVMSNSAIALYYAEESPLPDNASHMELDDAAFLNSALTSQDYFIHAQNRHRTLSLDFSHFKILAQFSNRRGDTAYVLVPK
ncbi:hypothetical protein [Suttonella ornithocola]|uniref:Glycosyltransferase RgtA/B/C/D-like domain-containing protein n=1 Tax=Suttonella ornithocola TaxID=279832 RepID=A0A380N0X3_9GAMM|nr:hypothetical protein [Suttonella ornithocola]SUO97407.1 Uncharacterised protein [Suttonella ornithocola]